MCDRENDQLWGISNYNRATLNCVTQATLHMKSVMHACGKCKLDVNCSKLVFCRQVKSGSYCIHIKLPLPHMRLTWLDCEMRNGIWLWLLHHHHHKSATLQHHQEICILNAGVNQPRVTVWIGDLVRDAVSILPSRNAYLQTSCMNGHSTHAIVSCSATCTLTYSRDSMWAHIHAVSS